MRIALSKTSLSKQGAGTQYEKLERSLRGDYTEGTLCGAKCSEEAASANAAFSHLDNRLRSIIKDRNDRASTFH